MPIKQNARISHNFPTFDSYFFLTEQFEELTKNGSRTLVNFINVLRDAFTYVVKLTPGLWQTLIKCIKKMDQFYLINSPPTDMIFDCRMNNDEIIGNSGDAIRE